MNFETRRGQSHALPAVGFPFSVPVLVLISTLVLLAGARWLLCWRWPLQSERSQNSRSWKRPQRSPNSTPLPCAGTPPSRPGCPAPHPAWPRALPLGLHLFMRLKLQLGSDFCVDRNISVKILLAVDPSLK